MLSLRAFSTTLHKRSEVTNLMYMLYDVSTTSNPQPEVTNPTFVPIDADDVCRQLSHSEHLGDFCDICHMLMSSLRFFDMGRAPSI